MQEAGRSSDEIVIRDGLVLLLDGRSLADHVILEHGDWEPAQRRRLFALAAAFEFGPNAVFLDIGAYFGCYALHASRSPHFGEIYAFEPDRLNFAQLQACLFLNRATERIAARNVHVGAAPGTTEMTRSAATPANRASARRFGGKDDQIVPVDSIDNMLNHVGQQIVAKIDVELSEFDVLAGMRRTIAENKILLQIECANPGRLKVACAAQGLRYLERLGETIGDYYFTNA
ncbi:MAG TPA: FkbM family methyltransferase [Xanthobacteraceae bacterium]|nr:FkbM family methyltransferase [Xanthobacteraceae bacterium]